MNVILGEISSIVWGPFTLVLLLGVGVFLTIGLKFFSVKKINFAFRELFGKGDKGVDGDITPFESLMTALSATVGTGNIAGVATAIFLGGPGAIFWMWITAFFGMATKYAEAFLAVYYREKNDNGNFIGGPMYYIKNGLHKNYSFLAYAFAVFGMIAAFGIGNGVQSNSVAQVVSNELVVSELSVGLFLLY